MATQQLSAEDFHGVVSVPPLARNRDQGRTLNLLENDKVVAHIASGGVTRFLYGGNALLYHVSMRDYTQMAEWMSGYLDRYFMIPSIGPSFGRASEQAELLRNSSFSCAMMLPSADPRTAAGLEAGYREVAALLGKPLLLYVKEESNFGADKEKGLDVIGRLIDSGVGVAVKYAVVRKDPREDAYLAALLKRVPAKCIISGIGERPAIIHMRDWKLPAFTSGSVCIAPRLSQRIFEHCVKGEFAEAEPLREKFIPHEDLRDAWGPAPVLHTSMELAGIAQTGPVLPYLEDLSPERRAGLGLVASALLSANG